MRTKQLYLNYCRELHLKLESFKNGIVNIPPAYGNAMLFICGAGLLYCRAPAIVSRLWIHLPASVKPHFGAWPILYVGYDQIQEIFFEIFIFFTLQTIGHPIKRKINIIIDS